MDTDKLKDKIRRRVKRYLESGKPQHRTRFTGPRTGEYIVKHSPRITAYFRFDCLGRVQVLYEAS